VNCGESGHTRGIAVGDMHARAARGKSLGDRLADTLRGTGYERDAAIVVDVHVSMRSWNVANDSGRRPSSMSWMSAVNRSSAGVATPASRPSLPMMPIWGSTSVLRFL